MVIAVGRAAVVTPLYISTAWTLLISYQLFTETAVNSVVQKISMTWSSIGGWLNPRIDVIVFVHAFAWIFVLASMTPSVILGKGRSVLLQFIVCLTVTLAAVWFPDIFSLVVGREYVDQVLRLAVWLENPWLAGLYLSIPYLMMLSVDLGERGQKLEKEPKEPEATEEDQPTVGRAEDELLMQTWQSLASQQN